MFGEQLRENDFPITIIRNGLYFLHLFLIVKWIYKKML